MTGRWPWVDFLVADRLALDAVQLDRSGLTIWMPTMD